MSHNWLVAAITLALVSSACTASADDAGGPPELAPLPTAPGEAQATVTAPPQASVTAADSHASSADGLAEVSGVGSLIVELEGAGATVDALSEAGSGLRWFSGRRVDLCVNGATVQLVEYDNVEQRQQDSATITTDGQIKGADSVVIVEWVGPPHFFAEGRLIALYLGDDPLRLQLLTGPLGATLSPGVAGSRGPGLPPCRQGRS